MRQAPSIVCLFLLCLLPPGFGGQGAGGGAIQQTGESLLLPPRRNQTAAQDAVTTGVKPTSATMQVSDIAHLFREEPTLPARAAGDTATTSSALAGARATTRPLGLMLLPPPGAIRGGRVWINEATAEELCEMLRIDYQRARNVVKYRELFGPYQSSDELRNVTGFHDAMIKLLRDKIGVAPPPADREKREQRTLPGRRSVPELSANEKQKARNARTHVYSSELP